ncbi:hypothetical protein [Mycolicibacterium sp. CBMA 226]|uniref:Rv1157c family protein n=1 Tax=Mycolicibacterium sp. CBMA 226 TaxID=2606611 RepID=UPI0012DE773C|nr:hypothetical protein [Mycolicibacterium sp. CBMA 226]MUL78110.1 hypothetical protein [Mycolicibacterium sp. CBMA 226]
MQSRKLFVALGASVALTISAATAAHADPQSPLPLPLPIDGLQAPGLPAMQTLAPVIQQAAADPAGAAELLMAAARAFAGSKGAPSDSKNLANAVNQFAADPAANHVPAPGAVPGTEAHLPAGVDPVHAVGPVAEAAPAAAPEAAPATAPEAAPASAPVTQAAGTVPAPDAAPAAAPAAGPAPAGAFGPGTPVTQDFMYPSISNGCLADGGNVLATAISVAGPAKIPTPGPGPGQTAYVFTAVGTPGPAAEQKLPLNVTWVNLTTGKSGSATLKPQADINPQGPTTLTAIVDTGSGSIMSTIFGQVTTTEKQCQFMPTIGSSVVP